MNASNNKDELDLQLSSYNYKIDSSLIANKPSSVRHKSRLMIVRNLLFPENYSTDKSTLDIVDEIDKGDLVIINDTKVMKARLKIELKSRNIIQSGCA